MIFYPGCKLEELSYFSFVTNIRSRLMKRLSIGFLIRDIFERLTNKANDNLDQSLWIYSAHDLTIVLLLEALGLAEVIQFLIFLFFSLKIIGFCY